MSELTAEVVVLAHGDHVARVVHDGTSATSFDRALRPQIKRLIEAFDAKPFTTLCFHCKAAATRGTIYVGGGVMWWCDDCDPYKLGAAPGRLIFVEKYADVLDYVRTQRTASASEYRQWIRTLVGAKNGPQRITAKTAAAFFSAE